MEVGDHELQAKINLFVFELSFVVYNSCEKTNIPSTTHVFGAVIIDR